MYPLPFDRGAEFFPGIERATYDIITANSGIGKSKLARFLYVMNAISWVKNNPDSDIRLKIFYFSLEETREKFMMSMMSYYLWVNFRLRISVKQLRSVGKNGYFLPDDVLEKIEQAKEYFSDFEQYVTIIDNVSNPTGIFKYMKTYHEENGIWTTREFLQDGNLKTVKDQYTPNDPNEYVMCITDHISLLDTESGMNLYDTIGRFSARYGVELRNKYGTIFVVVQQQAAEKEKKQFTFRGQSIIEKLEPSMDGLGDNKSTQRDADNIFGLFAPDRYQIDEINGYNVKLLKDHFRMLLILKSRDGDANIRIPLFFDGATGNFTEMPKASDVAELEKVYQYVRNGMN